MTSVSSLIHDLESAIATFTTDTTPEQMVEPLLAISRRYSMATQLMALFEQTVMLMKRRQP